MKHTSCTVALACLLGAASVSCVRSQDAPATYGLFIGIDAYPQPHALPNCVHDAEDMASWCRSRGVPAENVKVLIDGDATADGILEGLRWLEEKGATGAELYVYYSGHGSRVRDRNGDEEDGFDESWVSVDLRHIADDELGALLDRLSGRVLVISDSCHSGTVTKSLELDAPSEPDAAVEASLRKFLHPDDVAELQGDGDHEPVARDIGVLGRKQQERNATGGRHDDEHGLDAATTTIGLLASCSDQQVSNATPFRNSAFTRHLLESLRSAPPDATFGWLRDSVDAALRNHGYRYPQNPSLSGLSPQDRLPPALGGGRRPQEPEAVEAEAEPAETTLAEGARVEPGHSDTEEAEAERLRRVQRGLAEQLLGVVRGLVRRERSAPQQRQSWIRRFSTPDGRSRFRTGEDELVLEVEIAEDAPRAVWICVLDVGPTGNVTLLHPNGYEGNRPAAAGETRRIGGEGSELWLPFQEPAGTEHLVALALEWDPFAGFDWTELASTDHVLLQRHAPADQCETMLRARDVGVRRRPERARPGEGWDRRVLTVTHR